MRVIGFNFEKISAERKEAKSKQEKLEINSNINVREITQESLDMVKDKPVLKLNFEFKVEYKPNVADIKLEGIILLLVEKDEAKNIIKKWKNKKIDLDVKVPIFNLILTKCNLKALELEEELNLPTHIPLPRVSSKQEQGSNNRNYAG